MGNTAHKGDDRYAFNVVDVKPQSPGQRCGLMPFHDFILSVNGNMLNNMDKDEIISFINESENTHVKLKVFNRARNDTREVTMYPTKKWPGDGLLGITIRLEKYMDAGQVSNTRVGRRRSVNCRTSETEGDFSNAMRGSNDVDYDDIYKFESPIERRKSLSAGQRPSSSQQQGFLARTLSVNAASRARLETKSASARLDSSGEKLHGQESPLRKARADLLGSRDKSSSEGQSLEDAKPPEKIKKPLTYRVSRAFVRTVTFNPKPKKQQNI